MANDFSGDIHCRMLMRFESGALATDSIGSNAFTDNNTVGTDASDYQEGSACALFTKANYEYFSQPDLSSDLPMVVGDSNKKISVCLWFKPTDLGATQYLFAKYAPSSGLRSFIAGYIDSGSKLRVYLGYNSGASIELLYTSPAALQNDRWYHFAWTFNDADKSWQSVVWDDTAGSKVVDTSGTAAHNISLTSTDFTIGSYSGGGDWFDGNIDELVVFDDILTTSEIDAIRSGTYSSGGGGTTETLATSIDALIQQTGITQTVSLDAYLQSVSNTQIDIDALLQALNTNNISLDAFIQLTQEKSVSIDALLQAVNTNNISIEAFLYIVLTQTLSIDAILNAGLSEVVSLDSLLQSSNTNSLDLNALVQSLKSSNTSIDSLLQTSDTKQLILDALLQSVITQSVSIDAILINAGQHLQSTSLDALVQAIKSNQFSLDAMLQSLKPNSLSLDAILFMLNINSISLDSLLMATKYSMLSLDSLLMLTSDITISLDALLLAYYTTSISLDAILTLLGGRLGTSIDAILNSLLDASQIRPRSTIYSSPRTKMIVSSPRIKLITTIVKTGTT